MFRARPAHRACRHEPRSGTIRRRHPNSIAAGRRGATRRETIPLDIAA